MIYKTHGVCSQAIDVEVENGIITSIKFVGGCSGNTQGVAALATGMKAEDAIEKLEGIRCGMRPTSCPDQLAKALKSMQ
ncbi:MAG: TIGR03905 family TSCPD domain-containing protein [Lachnospiraceae bacterium]|nr:TIGR03905 family TSCPD domain-containing protein [Lachnospiraceae bacterium]